jgi:MFS family permease
MIGAIATVFKLGSGWLCEIVRPPVVTAIGLVLQAVGMVIFGFADTTTLQYASAIAFGTGWGLSYVAGTVLLIEFFGRDIGSQLLSCVWFIVSVAAVGPIAAGFFGDNYGTFAPIYVIYGAMMAGLALPILVMRRPAEDVVEADRSHLMPKATAI